MEECKAWVSNEEWEEILAWNEKKYQA